MSKQYYNFAFTIFDGHSFIDPKVTGLKVDKSTKTTKTKSKPET